MLKRQKRLETQLQERQALIARRNEEVRALQREIEQYRPQRQSEVQQDRQPQPGSWGSHGEHSSAY